MSEDLRTCVKPDMTKWEPVLKFSESTVTTEKTRLDRRHELQHKMEYDVCQKKRALRSESA